MATIESLEPRRLFSGTFGGGGAAVLNFRVANASEKVKVEQVLSDGDSSYVVASTQSTLQVQRLTSTGQLDRAWGRRGMLVFPRKDPVAEARLDPADRLHVLVDGKITRLTDAGAADTAFADKGTLAVGGFTSVADFTIDTTNHLYVTGTAKVGSKNVAGVFRVERFISRGKADKGFDGDGVFDVPFYKAATGSRTASSNGMFVRALVDGTTVAAGTEVLGSTATPGKYTSRAIQAVRFDADGTVTSDYGTNGVATVFQKNNTDTTGYNVTLQGVRAGGQAVWYSTATDGGLGSGTEDQSNLQFSLDGDTVTGLGAGYDPASYYYARFEGQIAGTGTNPPQDLAVLNQNSLGLLNSLGGVEEGFNNSRGPLRLGFGKDRDTRQVAVAAFTSDLILTAANNRDGNRITVGLIKRDGTVL